MMKKKPRLGREQKRKATCLFSGAANAQQERAMVKQAHKMKIDGPLRFRRGGYCSRGGATTASIWDYWEIIPRRPRQRYHRVWWTYFWFPDPDLMECRQKEFLFSFKNKTTALTPKTQDAILNHYRSMSFDLATFGGGDQIKGQWELP